MNPLINTHKIDLSFQAIFLKEIMQLFKKKERGKKEEQKGRLGSKNHNSLKQNGEN